MDARLTAIPFTRDDLDAVVDFHCGDARWARYVTDWIQGKPGGVLEALDIGTQVWLYLDQQNEVVGFGSLGYTEWVYPDPFGRGDSKRVPLCIIPAYGVDVRFHKKPNGDWQQHYSSEILADLIAVAAREWTREYGSDPNVTPLLGLFVDEQNTRAMRHYENHGFSKYGKPIRNRGQRMLLKLTP